MPVGQEEKRFLRQKSAIHESLPTLPACASHKGEGLDRGPLAPGPLLSFPDHRALRTKPAS
jgi:hypothetical protein